MAVNVYYKMLKSWCDRLLELQITEKKEKTLYGGILCPACGRIHGRCFDAMYPMLFLYRETGEKKYKDCAMRLFSWSDNLYRREGYYENDTNSSWKGTTVFSAAQLGECLLDFGELFPEEYQDIRKRFEVCAEYLRTHIEEIGGNINYPVSCTYTMAVAEKVTGEKKYAEKAAELAGKVPHYITEDGLLYGEGHNWEEVSPRGCRPVDIGYNVEESLPAFLQYALLEKDEKAYQLAVELMQRHLEFMLPDGSWDDSFGTRNYKWSYWGSRTSDGCLTGYGLIDNAVFREAVRRNTLLLQRCTCQGLLSGGLMYEKAEEPPCVHHTFCHAKAFALLLEKASPEQIEKLNDFNEKASLPSDSREGIVFFPSLQVLLLGKGSWRATVTGYDVEYTPFGHPSGGAVSLLWQKEKGPVLAGGMGNYTLTEPNNMQLLRNRKAECITFRIEYEKEGKRYRSCNDKTAAIDWRESSEAVTVEVTGKMTAEDGTKDAAFWITYELRESGLTIYAACDEESKLLLYPISENVGENSVFSPVGGFLAEQQVFSLPKGIKSKICIAK